MQERSQAAVFLHIKPATVTLVTSSDRHELSHLYIKIKIGEKTYKTAPCKKFDIAPTWSDIFSVKYFPNTTALVQLKNKHTIKSNKLIGEGRLTCDKLLSEGRGEGLWLDLYKVNEFVGRVQLMLLSKGDEQSESTHTQEMTVSKEDQVIMKTKQDEVLEKNIEIAETNAREMANKQESRVVQESEIIVSGRVEGQPIRREIIHIKPVIETQVHVKPVITREIIIDKSIYENYTQEQAILTKETITDKPFTRSNGIVQNNQVVQEYVNESPEYRELPPVQDVAVVAKEIIRERPIIHKEVHQQPIVTKEITHNQPIIQKEVREIMVPETELKKRKTVTKQLPVVEKPTEKALIHEEPIVHTTIVKDEPVLGQEVVHEKELITREIHEKPIINKDIYEVKPIVEKEIREVPVQEIERVRKDTEHNERVILEKEQKEFKQTNQSNEDVLDKGPL